MGNRIMSPGSAGHEIATSPAVSREVICRAKSVPCRNPHNGTLVQAAAHVHLGKMDMLSQAIAITPPSVSRFEWSTPAVLPSCPKRNASANLLSDNTKPSTPFLSLLELPLTGPAAGDLSHFRPSIPHAQRVAASTNDGKGPCSPVTVPVTKTQHEVDRDRNAVVFLDIDGVLHPWQSNTLFHRECCLLYERIIRRTCALTVLSSTWRKYPDQIAMVENILKLLKLDPIYGFTIDLGGDVESRGEEILEWLGRHPDVRNWIAIDDVDLTSSLTPCGHLLCGHFVHTNPDKGLLPGDVDLAVQLLGGDVYVVVKV